jgi:nucleoid DNA-binding protein
MIPKKANKLYSTVAEDLNVSETLVEDVVEFYYKEVRKNLSELSEPRINIEGLGHFVAKHGTIIKTIERFQKSLVNHDVSTFKAYHNKKGMEVKLGKLIELEKKLSQQADRKKEFFKTKKNESSSKDNLGE